MLLRAFILGGLLIGFWLGLRRAGIGGRERAVTWVAISFPLLAVPVALYVRSGARGGRASAFAWNVLGIADLAVAIAMGALTTTGRLPVEISNTATRSYPLVMIPAFAVPLSLILHALSLRQLRR